MSGGGLKKDFSKHRLAALKADPLFPLLAEDVAAGTVLPAVRDEEMHFYFGGARLLTFTTGFRTHSRYQCAANDRETTPARYERFLVSDGLEAAYARLKASCEGYRNGGELQTIARIYRTMSHARRDRPMDVPTLLDVEVRFPGPSSAQPHAGKKKGASDMVDMLFALPSGRLCFIEAKRTKDPRARSEGEPEVARQIRGYESQVSAVDHILATYANVQAVLNDLFDCPIVELAGVFHKVPLLILGEWRPSSKEQWQARWVERSRRWAVDDEFILIEGGGEDSSPALLRFLTELDRRLA